MARQPCSSSPNVFSLMTRPFTYFSSVACKILDVIKSQKNSTGVRGYPLTTAGVDRWGLCERDGRYKQNVELSLLETCQSLKGNDALSHDRTRSTDTG